MGRGNIATQYAIGLVSAGGANRRWLKGRAGTTETVAGLAYSSKGKNPE